MTRWGFLLGPRGYVVGFAPPSVRTRCCQAELDIFIGIAVSGSPPLFSCSKHYKGGFDFFFLKAPAALGGRHTHRESLRPLGSESSSS